MPYCPKCGKPAPPKSAYCPVCGTNIPHDVYEEPAPTFPPASPPPQTVPKPPPVPLTGPFGEIMEPPPVPAAVPDFPFPPEKPAQPTYPPLVAPAPPPPPLDYPPPSPQPAPTPPPYMTPASTPPYAPPSAPQAPPAAWQGYEAPTPKPEPVRPSPRFEESYATRRAYDDYDMPVRRSHGGAVAVVIIIILVILGALYFGGVFNTAPPPNPQEDYKKVYESAAAAVHSKNSTALYSLLSTASRNRLDTLLPKEKRLDSTLDEKSDSSSMVKTALERGNLEMFFPAGDQPATMKELEGGRVSLTTQQGKMFWLTKEDDGWKLDLDPGAFGYDARRYLVLDAWDKLCETIKSKNAVDLYNQLDRTSQQKAEEEAKLPAYKPVPTGQPPKPRPKSGPPAFKSGKELFEKSFAEAKDLPDPTVLKIRKLELKENTANITLTNGSLVVLKEENSFWRLDLLYDGGPPVVLLGQTALIATGKAAPATSAPPQPGNKDASTTGSEAGTQPAGGRYVISGTATVTGDAGGGRSGYSIADKINGNFNKRVQLGLISASPSKAGTATANFTIGKDGSVYGVNVSSSNGDLSIEIRSACLSSRFGASSGETKVTYHATVTQ